MNDQRYEYQGTQFIGKLSSEIYRRGYVYFSKRLIVFGINYIQLLCLISLYIEDHQTQEQITDDLSIDKASVHRAIKGLIDVGYVNKERDLQDGRAYRVILTVKGKKIQPEISQMMAEREILLSQGIDPEEKKIAFKVLKQITNNANEIYQAEKKNRGIKL
ncbi:MarR family winged helix-turn-helix transcriptional regulator [Enterococcus hermanniensis]|uniref:MarR family transcriptional regulator n=1 Tax=Enterococcus hermanniensis TaxID=249189 RepID=A0A1L8TQH9_9ENTE|nr:MarR family winged helix-turn-helix transcriptional regulator [Enterococcus hermanniensis]OJG46566.1 MarR family transcriptional regulator [Enterococcus hermanniensis]